MSRRSNVECVNHGYIDLHLAHTDTKSGLHREELGVLPKPLGHGALRRLGEIENFPVAVAESPASGCKRIVWLVGRGGVEGPVHGDSPYRDPEGRVTQVVVHCLDVS